MTDIDERFADLIDDKDGLPRRVLLAELDRFYTQPASPSLRISLQTTLYAHARQTHRPARRRTPLFHRLAALAAALLLVLSGGTAYLLRVPAPTPVSAQEILRRAAAAVAPIRSRVIHEIIASESTPQTIGKAPVVTPERTEMWVEVNSQGLIARTSRTATDHTGIVSSRVKTSTTAGMTTTEYLAMPRASSINSAFEPASDCAGVASTQETAADVISYHGLLVKAAQHINSTLRVLPRRRLDGRTVDVVEEDSSTLPGDIVPLKASGAPTPYREDTYYYIDPQTYILRGSDTYRVAPKGKMTRTNYLRILLYETLPLSAVPKGAFHLHAPAGAQRTPVFVTLPRPCPLSVKQAVVLSPHASPLLSGHPYGLNLDRIIQLKATGSPTETVGLCSGFGDNLTITGSFADYQYQSRSTSNPVTKDFCVAVSVSLHASVALPQVMYATPQGKAHSKIPLLKPSMLHLTIAGQRVEASYHLTIGQGNRGSNLLWFALNGRTVAITGHQIDQRAFFGLVKSLVDARTHPAIMADLQRRLDTSR